LTYLVWAGNAKRGVPAISEGGDKIDIKLNVDNHKSPSNSKCHSALKISVFD
jgi:hypothetical protein